jgi:hypothetical protein
MDNIKIEKIITRARPGSNLTDCIRKCLEISIKEWRVVTLEHNSREYTINPERIYDVVLATEEKIKEEK